MKKLLLVLLSVLMLAALVGCSKSEPAEGGEEGGAEEAKVFYIGVVQLVQHAALDAATQGFVDEVKKEFPDADIVVLNASGDSANCSTISQGFVNDSVDLIMANATPALQAAVSATADIPILGTSVTEYGVALGIENFNGLPGSNVSGTRRR